MTRYVNVEKLTHRIMDADYINTACEVLIEIECMPEEDVAPVVHAYWRDCYGHYVYVDDHGYPDGECLCSACGDYLTASDEYYVRGVYCPNCGAKMDGDPDA